MRRFSELFAGLFMTLALTLSCGLPSYEQQGDDAYMRAQKTEGLKKLEAQKLAYVMYKKAMLAHPDKVSAAQHDRFLEMTITRAEMILTDGGASSDALPLFQEEINTYLSVKSPAALRQQYALLLVQIADSFVANTRYSNALDYFNKAVAIAADPSPVVGAKQQAFATGAKAYLDRARQEYTTGKKDKNAEAMILAEYYAEAAFLLDSTMSETQKLRSDIRKETISVFSNFRKVIDAMPDTALFKKVDKFDIFFAIPSMQKGGPVVLNVRMLNRSYNPVRLSARDFYLADTTGKRYQALPATLDPDLLDQDRQATYVLRFPRPAGTIAKLIYSSGPHYSEKCFF